ncbi:MAG TPA: hypothetical protein DCY13_10510 [Verrucomicrobiales bacterium]|nr:hypothetical protein [Verrucomicrobiales bacterium]
MSDPSPPAPDAGTFSEKLARRPRARFFTIFSILGFGVSPAAAVILLVTRGEPVTEEGGRPIRLEAIIAAVLIALHALCIYLAWHFWRDEAANERHDRDEAPSDRKPA